MKGKLSQESVIYPAQYCRKSIANINDARSEVAALNQQKTTLALLALLRANPNSKPTLNAAVRKTAPNSETSKGEFRRFCSVPAWKACGKLKQQQHNPWPRWQKSYKITRVSRAPPTPVTWGVQTCTYLQEAPRAVPTQPRSLPDTFPPLIPDTELFQYSHSSSSLQFCASCEAIYFKWSAHTRDLYC